MSQTLKDSISRGESLADEVLRQVFASKPTSDSHPPSNGTEVATAPSSLPTPFRAESLANDGKRHLLLACSGSVATIKLPNMLQALAPFSSVLSTIVILTESAARFLQGQAEEQPDLDSLTHIPGVAAVLRDADEWSPSWTRGAPILHIELRRWADLLVVAPLSANTLAKVVGGLCDNLLTSVIRAWDTEASMSFNVASTVAPNTDAAKDNAATTVKKTKTIMVAPAMNTAMWNHPITAKQIKILQEDWHWTRVLLPSSDKQLACGDIGTGAMKEWSSIVNDITNMLELQHRHPLN